jgi:putative spermidine/putrescine transport system ATP-binding protein
MLLEQISIRYNQENIISHLDLDIRPGEIFVLMGPSGSGKTTLLKGIAGLLPITSGKISGIKGSAKVGLVFQEPRLFPHMTVIDNIAFSLRIQGIPREDREKQAHHFIKILKLDGLEDRLPHQLSGGQQQRVSLGRTLILKPNLLLLDEPFASLDPSLRMELIEWLYQFQRKMRFSILWVTHFLEEAFSVADRIGIMIEGSLKQVGKPQELFQNPSSEIVASFLSLPNRFSRDQWQKWFQYDLQQTKERGWISPFHLQIIHSTEESLVENKMAGYITGVVTKILPGKDGLSMIIKSQNCLVEARILEIGKAPKLNIVVTVKIPFEQINWYHA